MIDARCVKPSQSHQRALAELCRAGTAAEIRVGRTTLGRALVAAGKPAEAVTELILAAAQADRLGSPSVRWDVLADNAAETAFSPASTVIRDIASGLDPYRAEGFLGAEPVREVLKGATKAQL